MSSHKTTTAFIVMTLGAIAATASAAWAGGDVIDYGAGIRQRVPAAVPVPAPVPVPETSSGYYIRVDAAYGRGDVSKYQTSNPFSDQIRSDQYLNNAARFGFGVGYQFSRMFRADITMDWRGDVVSKLPTTTTQRNVLNNGGIDPDVVMRDTVADSFKSTNVVGLINGYLDLPVSRTFTPYVGAGVGFVRHHLRGERASRSTCVSNVGINADCDPTVAVEPAYTGLNYSSIVGIGGSDMALATAVMAGFTYQVWENTKLDIGYRWLHLQGTQFTGSKSNTADFIRIPDQNIHEMRVGVRYDIN